MSSGEVAATFADGLLDNFDLQSDSKNTITRLVDASNSSVSNFSAAAASLIAPLWDPYANAHADALTATTRSPMMDNNTCGRVNIMGTIVKDSTPYLFPFIIEYSLIGAAVIYVMWKHIGRYPRCPHQAEADLERRLEAMLSRRAVALAQAGTYDY